MVIGKGYLEGVRPLIAPVRALPFIPQRLKVDCGGETRGGAHEVCQRIGPGSGLVLVLG
jgi:hypothetical protein